MKIIPYIILLVFWSTGLFAQEGGKLTSFCQNFSYQELENGLNDLKNKSTKEVEYRFNTKLDRELVNDVFEIVIEFTKRVQGKMNSAVHTIYIHKVKLIKNKNGKIAYYKVVQLKNVKSKGEWVSTEIILKENSNSLFQQLKKDFKNTYSEPLDSKGLFKTDIVYGRHCGFAGIEPKYRVKMNELVMSKDKATLVKWLKSTTLEI
ncbi:MAG: hypothetical protein DRI84_10285, partial [Bacteroidetes bacterium]